MQTPSPRRPTAVAVTSTQHTTLAAVGREFVTAQVRADPRQAPSPHYEQTSASSRAAAAAARPRPHGTAMQPAAALGTRPLNVAAP